MKYIVGLLIILALSFGNSSCQKEFLLDDVDSTLITPPPTPEGVKGSFTANIDGTKFNADKVSGAYISLGTIIITGTSNAGETIYLGVKDSGVHIYSLNTESMANVGAYTKGNEYSYGTNEGVNLSQSGGTLAITSIDEDKKTISGKFSIIVYRALDKKQKKITGGVFNDIPYDTKPMPSTNAKDTFRVKIDGTFFPANSISGFNLNNMISITVNNQGASKTIGITMPSGVKAGIYSFSSSVAGFSGQYNPTSTTYLSASFGEIIILEHNILNKRIKGNFNFEAKELVGNAKASLTEGYFSVTYK